MLHACNKLLCYSLKYCSTAQTPVLICLAQIAWKLDCAAQHEIGVQVCVEVVGYLLEELRDAKNFESFRDDMQNANIFIGSLIFIEELADKVSIPARSPEAAARTRGCQAPWRKRMLSELCLRALLRAC